jgi:aminoglycoside phosphotransferase (APT) family kinase protein
MNESIDEEKLEKLVRKIDPQSSPLRSWELKGGLSPRMTAFELRRANGQTEKLILRRTPGWALKWDVPAVADEFKILQQLESFGIAAQTPYYFDNSGDIFPDPYMVIEYIDGRSVFTPPDVSDYLSQAAAQLVKIHGLESRNCNLSFLPNLAQSLDKQFSGGPRELDASLDEGLIRKQLELAWPWPNMNEAALLHGDFWPGNLLWNEGQLAAVIDWEGAQSGDPLADVSISRLDILWLLGIEAMHEFTEAYRSLTTIDFSNLPYWDLCTALRPMGHIGEWAGVYPALGRADITEQTMRADHRLFVEQALERLD